MLEMCSEEAMNEKTDPFVMINILNIADQESLNAYSGKVIFHLFPVISANIWLSGEPQEEYWDQLALMYYPNRRDFCAMANSEEFHSVFKYKAPGLADAYTYYTYVVA